MALSDKTTTTNFQECVIIPASHPGEYAEIAVLSSKTQIPTNGKIISLQEAYENLKNFGMVYRAASARDLSIINSAAPQPENV